LLGIRSSSDGLGVLVARVAELIAPRPCAAELRVYGELSNPAHVFLLSSAFAAIPLLDRCEAVGVFDSENVPHDRHAVMKQLHDPSGPDDDEACLLRVIHPRPVLFLHAGHEDIDVVCGRGDAERLLGSLSRRA
jgi:hypothetical protein